MRSIAALLLAAAVLAGCSGTSSQTDEPSEPNAPSTTAAVVPIVTSTTVSGEPESHLPWWNDRVFYEVFVRSFQDSDGDGIGDFAGLIDRLDYLNDADPTTTDDLGVTGMWLMPIFPSPSYHGYDVTDYRTVNPDYGTMADFKALLAAAHERGIAVLIDLVINHSSRRHPWFVAAAAGDADYTDWYRWSATDPGTTSPWDDGPLWHPEGDEYFFGLFWEGMPDLNLENPAVTAELYDIARFWLEDVGVDGFRLDGARHLIEDGEVVSDTAGTVAWLKDFNAYVDSIAPDALVLGEVWSPTATVAGYLPDALDLAFEFDLAAAAAAVIPEQSFAPLEQAMEAVEASYPELQYATFLTNHDMNRVMSTLGGDAAMAKLAATWLLTAPGVPFVYYGEEVGLEGEKPDERIRTPMPWTAAAPGVGFTTGDPWQAPDDGFVAANVADQVDDPGSLLSHYRALIQGRSTSLALRRGNLISVEAADPTVTAYLRSEGDDHVLVVLNAAPDYATNLSLDLPAGPLAGMHGVVPIAGPEAVAPDINPTGGFDGYAPVPSIAPFGYLVLRFTPDPTPPPPVTTTTVAPTTTTIPATEQDVAAVEDLYRVFARGDYNDLPALLADDAVLIDGTGSPIRFDEVLPPEAGFDASWDWDGDGTVTIADIVNAQNAFGRLVLTSFEAECEPAGDQVACVIKQSDVFGDRAGNPPAVIEQTFRVSGGLVTEMGSQQPQQPLPGAEEAWLVQFAAYERWLSGNHPDVYEQAFRGPCCTGSPDGMWFTSTSIEAQRPLITQWAQTP